MVTKTQVKRRKVKSSKPKVETLTEPVVTVAEPVMTEVIETCFYCRESKYEPSTTGCPVISHTQKK